MKKKRFYIGFSICYPLPIRALTLLCLFLLPLFSFAAVINVPADYPTIQAAINASIAGDEIIVSPGTYYENISFLGKNIVLRSTDPTSPTVVDSTIIDGRTTDSVVTFYGIENETCVLSGFTITNGYSPRGGGIYGNGTLATIQNNTISTNTAYRSYLDGIGGGLAYCDGIIQNNTISGNLAYLGGGLYWCDGPIQNNTISGNSASQAGGGLFVCGGTIQSNAILGNSALDGGGLLTCNGTIQNNIILGNSAGDTGAGLYSCRGIIQNNTISGNLATDCGGGLHYCHGTIQNNTISGNSAVVSGGGLNDCRAIIQNNTIYGNSAGNTGGGLTDCSNTIRNCIIWQNTAPLGAQLYYCATPSYSCIQGWPGGGSGNISDNPQLVDPLHGDFHLLTISPCIDAGCYIAGLAEDFEGDPRPFDSTLEPRGDGSDYDIGADEYYPICTAIPVDTWTFEPPPEGWSYRMAAPPSDIPAWAHATSVQVTSPGALGINSPVDETTDYYGSWDNYSGDPSIPAISWVDKSVWQAKFTMSTDKSYPNTVPPIRLRFGLNHMKATSYILLLPGDWVPIAERGVSTTDYKLYLRPPIVDNGFFLAFDLIDFGQPFGVPCDGTVWLEEAAVDRFDLTHPCFDSYWIDVRSYSGIGLHSWTHSSGGVPYLTDVDYYTTPTDGLKQATTMAQTRAFGAWNSPTDEIDIVTTPQLYRAVWTLSCEDSALGGAERVRMHTQGFRYSSYMVIDRDADPANSALPPSSASGGKDYYIYAEFPGTPTVDKLLLAWDLFDFGPEAGGWAKLNDVAVSRRELP